MPPAQTTRRWMSCILIAIITNVTLMRPRAGAAQLADIKDQIVAIDWFDNAWNPDSCNRIRIHDINSRSPIVWGSEVRTPAHIAATRDLSVVVGNTAGNTDRRIFGFTSRARKDGQWRSVYMAADNDLSAPVMITRDDVDLIVPYSRGLGRQPLIDMYTGSLGPDMWQPGALPPPEAVIDGIHPAAMTDSLDARTVFVASDRGEVYKIDRASFKTIGSPLAYRVTDARRLNSRMRTYMAISPDGRYLVINGGPKAELTVVDIEAWSLSTVKLEGLTTTWGLDFNYQVDEDVFAVHGKNRIGVYHFQGTGQPVMLAMASVPPYTPSSVIPPEWVSAPDLIWSGRGDKVVAFAGVIKSLALFDYASGPPASLKADGGIQACEPVKDRPGWEPLPIAMVSSNRAPYIPPPTPTPTPTYTPTATPSSTPTDLPTLTPSPTRTPTASPTSTFTPSPTAPPTRTPAPAYLPLLLRERCLPEQRRVDVVLVLDASLSMLEPAGGEAPPAAARSKLDAARDAARALLDALRLAPGSGPGQGPDPAPGQGAAEGDQAAIVAFNSAATLLSPLSADRAALDAALGAIAPGPQTCIVCGVDAAAQELASARHRPGSAAVLVLLTDGRSNPQPPAQAVARAQAAKAAGVRVYTIGLGADLDEAALREMASGDDGYRHAPSAAELAGIYRGIAVDIPCGAGAFWAGR